MRLFARRFLLVFLLLIVFLIVGTFGYLQLGWSLSDSLFMTVITLTAVGYEEVRPLTDAGRALATLLLAGGLTVMGLWFALLTSAIVEWDLTQVFRKRRNMKRIEDQSDHIIVCGAGRTGRRVVQELEESGTPYVVIERDDDRAESLRELAPEAPILLNDATRDESLVEAGIGRARGLVSCLSADTDNLFVCLSARDLQPNLTIVARAYDEETMQKLYKAGADHVVSPNLTGGIRMASMLIRPEVMSFLDVVTRGDGLALRLEQVGIPENSPLAGSTLADARIPQKTGLIVIAVRHPEDSERGRAIPGEGNFLYNPGPEERITPGDLLIVLGSQEQVERLRKTVAA